MDELVKKLEERYKDVMNNESITRLSNWVIPNSDDKFDERKAIEHAKKSAKTLEAKVLDAIENND